MINRKCVVSVLCVLCMVLLNAAVFAKAPSVVNVAVNSEIMDLAANTGGDEACCDVPGDADNSGTGPSILDITYLVSYLYKGGPSPVCMAEGDPNGDGAINILDITFIVEYLYKDGPLPVCGPDPWPEG